MALNKKRTNLNDLEIVQRQARPLPVIILLDISGSMNEQISNEEGTGKSKIQILNECMRTMLDTFSNQDTLISEIHCQVTTFGGTAREHIKSMPAKDIEWKDLTAYGSTPMGGAFKIAKNIIEDKTVIASRSYRPTIILVSDGMPNDNWEIPMNELQSGRSGKADRMALFIGHGSGEEVLRKFLGEEHKDKFFTANQANQIIEFFRFVTMSVTTKSKSKDPNMITSKKETQQLLESNDGWENN